MADSKITALTSISTSTDPANDPLVIVDVSDTSMAATGTTKKVTLNQLLGASGTATLASATITGDLTVDTSTLKVDSANNRVGIGTASPSQTLQVLGTSGSVADFCGSGVAGQQTLLRVRTATGNASGLLIQGNFTTDEIFINNFYNASLIFGVNNTEQMRLNSTGLGIGTTTPTNKLEVVAPAGDNIVSTFRSGDATAANNAGGGFRSISSATAANRVAQVWLDADGANFSGGDYFIIQKNGNSGTVEFNQSSNAAMTFLTNSTERMRIDSSGNVGIGVTPKSWLSSYKAIQLGYSTSLSSTTGTDFAGLSSNAYVDSVDSRWERIVSGYATQYYQNAGDGQHIWRIAGTAAADTAITWTNAMTLDASGNLLVGTTSNPNSSRAAVKTASVTSALSLNSVTGDTAQELFVINKFDSNSTTSQVFARFTNNNGAAGSGQINGNGANACAFGSFSDARLKENIVSLPSQLANILSLRPVEFDYKDGSGHQIGFVAQEIQEVYADTVAEQNGFLTVTGWSKTEARLVSAIKELAAKVQALEAKLA